MKSVQINTLQSALFVDSSQSTTAVNVSAVGPLTVAVQMSVSGQSSANMTAQLQGSLDGTNFFLIGSSQTITANGQYGFSDTAPAYKYYSIKIVRTGGTFTADIRTFVYGDST